MELRIVSGSLRGRKIRVPEEHSGFRPTSGRVRESLAESLKDVIPGSAVADLYAGSGAFGFEMLSRGAASVDFVDSNRNNMNTIRKHSVMFGLEKKCRFVTGDVAEFVAGFRSGCYNIIFCDPPYGDTGLAEIIPGATGLLAEDGIFVIEHAAENTLSLPEEFLLRAFRCRKYGRTAVTFLRRR